MCGIVAVLRRAGERQPPSPESILEHLEAAAGALDAEAGYVARLSEASQHLAAADAELKGIAGLRTLLDHPDLVKRIGEKAEAMEAALAEVDRFLYEAPGEVDEDVEQISAALIAARDRLWAVQHDRLGNAEAVRHLAGQNPSPAAIEAYASIQAALAGIDRLEVRGRDSAGISILVWGHGLDLSSADVAQRLHRRADEDFTSGTVRVSDGCLGFVYKAAAEIGELGDNVAALRRATTGDALLRRAVAAPTAGLTVVAHTRWASVGTISQPNAHPLDGREQTVVGVELPHVVGVLNGDIDNFSSLVEEERLLISSTITTDAKVIPVLITRGMAEGESFEEAFSSMAPRLDGSMAIVANSSREPRRLGLAVRGSGQALYVGVAEDLFIVASEPYGVIEEAERYLRIDGDNTSGRLIVLDGTKAGSIEGIDRRGYDNRPLDVAEADLQAPEITTRDIDRRGFPHFLLKEITEAASSFRKTLRGRILNVDGRLKVTLPSSALPGDLVKRLGNKSISRVVVIGQGTAAVAAQAVASTMRGALRPLGVSVMSMPSTELSGFALTDDMSDTLVVAISQSGTTTDTNRTVDMAVGRGATIVGIVNRRNTDLVEKSHGVVFTSDGRDVEMSVASTKAFYAQIAAGFLLSSALAEGTGVAVDGEGLLSSLQELPAAMEQVLKQREGIAEIARRHAPRRRHWAVVGSGPNRVAAAEVRIKLSELCYKSVACDSTEDKKHIDLSAEPLIFVCAAGLDGSNADDVRKEIAIYRAHKAAPVIVASEDSTELVGGDLIPVPVVHPKLAFVLSAMAGHLFGYEAALAIDEQARPLRQIRAAIQELAGEGLTAGTILAQLPDRIAHPARQFLDAATHGAVDGVLNLGPAMRLALMLRCATGELPFEAYEVEHGSGVGPKAFLDDLVAVLTLAIDDLTRSIDAVKHQAKTVTVGISRSEALFAVPLVKELMRVGPRIEQLGYRSLRSLAALDPAIAGVQGFTRYVVSGDVRSSAATIHVVDKGGVAEQIRSRTDVDPRLRGTKRAALEKAEVEVTIGRSDGRAVILVPERKGDVTQGLTLLHVEFRDRLAPRVAREVLMGYRPARYEALIAAVTETEEAFREEVLGELSMPELLVQPVLSLADRWRSRR